MIRLPRDPEAALEVLAQVNPFYGRVWRSFEQGQPRCWYASLTTESRTLAATLGAETAAGLLRQLRCPPDRQGIRI